MSQPVHESSVSESTLGAAISLLYDNLAALPSKDYGVINMLPFAHDSESTRTVKRQVCEAIVELFNSHDLLKDDVPQAQRPLGFEITVKCVVCERDLFSMPTSSAGVSRVDAAQFIGTMASLNPECPHGVKTLDDLRRHLEDEFLAEEAQEAERNPELKNQLLPPNPLIRQYSEMDDSVVEPVDDDA